MSYYRERERESECVCVRKERERERGGGGGEREEDRKNIQNQCTTCSTPNISHPPNSQSRMGLSMAGRHLSGMGTSHLRLSRRRSVTSEHTLMASSEGGW